MGDAVPAFALGIGLEKFSYLEKQHDEDGFREFALRSGQKSYAQGTDGGDGHEEILVEHISAGDSLNGFFKCAESYEQVWDEIYCQHRQHVRRETFFYKDRNCEQYGCDSYKGDPAFHAGIAMPAPVCVAGCVVMCVGHVSSYLNTDAKI